MSLKTCLRVLPLINNSLKLNNKIILQPFHASLNKTILNTASISVRFLSSTKSTSKEVNSDIKTVYYGVLTPQIKAVKIFSLSSSIVGIIAQPFLYKEIAATGNLPVIIAAYSFIGFFTIVTPILLHLITRRYVTYLDYDEKKDSYVAKTVNFFCRTKETEFKTQDVVVPDVPGMFTTLLAKGKPIFFDPRMFKDPGHYAKLMGYDKPMDFKLYETSSTDAKKD